MNNVVIDESALTNLLYCGHLARICEAAKIRLYVAEYTYNRAIGDARRLLQRAVEGGRIAIESLPPDAGALLIAACLELDESEASAVAMARHWGWFLMSDDPVVRKFWGRASNSSSAHEYGTCELLRRLEPILGEDIVREAVRAIDAQARFRPRGEHASWWNRALQSK
jgi:hypothetical protein